MDDFSDRTIVLIDASRAAGEQAMHYFAKIRHGQSIKETCEDAHDPRTATTEADLASEQTMAQVCRHVFPGIALLGEESGYSPGYGLRLTSDGIDGTMWFRYGVLAGWGILAAIEDDTEVLSAVVSLPSTNEMIIAEKGGGCWYNYRGERRLLHGTDVTELKKAIIGMWRSDDKYPDRPIMNEEPFVSIRAKCIEAPNFMCSARTILALALGVVHGLVVPHHKYWDFVTLRCICRELGGDLVAFPLEDWTTPVGPEAFAAVRDGSKAHQFNIVCATNPHLLKEPLALVKTATQPR